MGIGTGPIVIAPTGDSLNQHVAMRSDDGSKILVYFSEKKPLKVDLSKLDRDKSSLNLTWFNPENGSSLKPVVEESADTLQEFTPPAGWQDALLVVNINN